MCILFVCMGHVMRRSLSSSTSYFQAYGVVLMFPLEHGVFGAEITDFELHMGVSENILLQSFTPKKVISLSQNQFRSISRVQTDPLSFYDFVCVPLVLKASDGFGDGAPPLRWPWRSSQA